MSRRRVGATLRSWCSVIRDWRGLTAWAGADVSGSPNTVVPTRSGGVLVSWHAGWEPPDRTVGAGRCRAARHSVDHAGSPGYRRLECTSASQRRGLGRRRRHDRGSTRRASVRVCRSFRWWTVCARVRSSRSAAHDRGRRARRGGAHRRRRGDRWWPGRAHTPFRSAARAHTRHGPGVCCTVWFASPCPCGRKCSTCTSRCRRRATSTSSATRR